MSLDVNVHLGVGLGLGLGVGVGGHHVVRRKDANKQPHCVMLSDADIT